MPNNTPPDYEAPDGNTMLILHLQYVETKDDTDEFDVSLWSRECTPQMELYLLQQLSRGILNRVDQLNQAIEFEELLKGN